MASKKFYVSVKVGNGKPRMFYFDGSPSTKQWEFSFDITTPEKKEESVKKMKERMLEAQKYQELSGLEANISIDWGNFWKLKEGGIMTMMSHLALMAEASVDSSLMSPEDFERMPVLPEGIVSKQAETIQQNKMRA